MSQTSSPSPKSSVILANHVLMAAAAIYIYDFVLTFPLELRFWRRQHSRRLLRDLLPLRYPMLILQIFILVANSWTQATPQVLVLTWRVHCVSHRRLWVSVPLGLLGLLAPLVNVAVPNPSPFPNCRLLNPSPPSRLTLVPVFRTIFDAIATVAFLVEFYKYRRRTVLQRSNLISEVMRESMMILAIMAMEAVFAQARNHARNYIAPFVDSITAILAARFIMATHERVKSEMATFTSHTEGDGTRRSGARNYPPFVRPPPEHTFYFSEVERVQENAMLSRDWPVEMPDAVHLRDPPIVSPLVFHAGPLPRYSARLGEPENSE
ncbi:hypothetical protein DFH08DRAFT_900422 [Mycena albidolilacea]|uniref:Uncharacterized protein n=1 Tax=Mycena albidolilacea TaxID=1033008 RepID=A0AAD6Z5V8_9AGAR|nr:hypothetical protein DFH08DRAFT_900422 [Mycena albidolilacea]